MSSKLLLLAIQCQTNGEKQKQFCASPDSVLGIPCVPGPWRCILSTFLPHIPQWKTNFCLVFVVSLVREGLSPVPMGMRPQMVLVWDPGLCTFSILIKWEFTSDNGLHDILNNFCHISLHLVLSASKSFRKWNFRNIKIQTIQTKYSFPFLYYGRE